MVGNKPVQGSNFVESFFSYWLKAQQETVKSDELVTKLCGYQMNQGVRLETTQLVPVHLLTEKIDLDALQN